MNQKDYRLGLDIGTNSVGWALVDLEWDEFEESYEKVGILAKGVRMFDRAENPKDGSSLALPRRLARSSRRRLGRRSERKQRIRNLLIKHELITKEELEHLYPVSVGKIDIWELRIEALDRLLSAEEWVRLLIHLSQRRGYKSNRKTDSNDKETGVVLSSIQRNSECLKKYRTVGEMWLKDEHFQAFDRRRNTTDSYVFSVSRNQLESEIQTLFKTQRSFGSLFAAEELEQDYLNIWNNQLPFASGEDILKRVGNCSIFNEELRIPKASYTFQYYIVLDAINRLRVGEKLNSIGEEKKEKVVQQIFNRKDYFNKKQVPEITYLDIRKWIGLEEHEKFKGLDYDPQKTLAQNEKVPFLNLKDYYIIHRHLTVHNEKSKVTYSIDDYDNIAFALTIYKTDDDIRRFLQEGNNPLNRQYHSELVNELLNESFAKFGHLSKKAIQYLIPKMENGLSFKEAAEALDLDTTGLKKKVKQNLLPVIKENIPNPIVKRALTQSRKIVNAIIRDYGSPNSVHIELARELSKNKDERTKLTTLNKENNERNRGAIAFLQENGVLNPTGYDIERYKLWKEQNQTCAYSLRFITPDVLIAELKRERNSAPTLEVDHIVPYSQSFMNGYDNKVLVYSDENRKKGNRLPFEYLSTIPGRWDAFQKFVEITYPDSRKKSYGKKRELLLKREMSEEAIMDLKDRHKNDTRYITRFFKNYIEQNLKFSASKDGRNKRVIAVSGQITSYLRKRWGLVKYRDETFLHHAMDAIVVACADDKMIQRITNYMKNKENPIHRFKIRFPQPWEGFRDDILTILAEEPVAEAILNKVQNNSPTDYLLVSRVPRYTITGEAHESTVRKKAGITKDGKVITTKRVHLRDINFDENGDFEMIGKETDIATYETIKNHYLAFNKHAKTAFAEENLPFKPIKEGKDPSKANKIKKVTVPGQTKSFVRAVNGGVANNGNLVRIDIFKRENKYVMVPIYVADIVLPELPNKYVKSGKGYELWPELDQHCKFEFSLFPNDVVYIEYENKEKSLLHFASVDISGNKIECKKINAPSDKRNHRFALGSIVTLRKLRSGILGDLKIILQEKRRAFKTGKKIKITQ